MRLYFVLNGQDTYIDGVDYIRWAGEGFDEAIFAYQGSPEENKERKILAVLKRERFVALLNG